MLFLLSRKSRESRGVWLPATESSTQISGIARSGVFQRSGFTSHDRLAPAGDGAARAPIHEGNIGKPNATNLPFENDTYRPFIWILGWFNTGFAATFCTHLATVSIVCSKKQTWQNVPWHR